MALTWDITEIHDYEDICWDVVEGEEAEHIRKNGTSGFFASPWREEDDGTIKVLSPVTNALIWMMMGLGVNGKITAKNADEVVRQVMIQQRVGGASLRQKNEEGGWVPRYITEVEVRQHIGLRTNCFGTNNTKRAFKEKIWQDLCRDAISWVEGRAEEKK